MSYISKPKIATSYSSKTRYYSGDAKYGIAKYGEANYGTYGTNYVLQNKLATLYGSIKNVTYLLKEDSDYLLLENGFRIILNKLGESIYANKQKLSTSYLALSKS